MRKCHVIFHHHPEPYHDSAPFDTRKDWNGKSFSYLVRVFQNHQVYIVQLGQ
jgi:hypothetical protein